MTDRTREQALADLWAWWATFDKLPAGHQQQINAERCLPVAETRRLLRVAVCYGFNRLNPNQATETKAA